MWLVIDWAAIDTLVGGLACEKRRRNAFSVQFLTAEMAKEIDDDLMGPEVRYSLEQVSDTCYWTILTAHLTPVDPLEAANSTKFHPLTTSGMRCFLSQVSPHEIDCFLVKHCPGSCGAFEQLMELAGLSVAQAIDSVFPDIAQPQFPEKSKGKVLVIVGPGRDMYEEQPSVSFVERRVTKAVLNWWERMLGRLAASFFFLALRLQGTTEETG